MKRVLILSSALLLAACSDKEGVTVGGDEGEVLEVVQVNQIIPDDGELTDPIHGHEVWFAYGAIAGVEGHPANGFLTGHFFEDRTFVHTIQLNIEPAPEGFFYEGWLIRKDPLDRQSTGHLRNLFGDARHQLKFERNQDLREYEQVIVTLEPDDGDPAPAEHVAEGMLKETKR